MVFVLLDMRSAFTRIGHRHILRHIQSRCPEFEPMFRQWYARSTTHAAVWGASESRLISQVDGLDQGGPLSPPSSVWVWHRH